MGKIALIGAHGYDRRGGDLRIDCFPWHAIGQITHLQDYAELCPLPRSPAVRWVHEWILVNLALGGFPRAGDAPRRGPVGKRGLA